MRINQDVVAAIGVVTELGEWRGKITEWFAVETVSPVSFGELSTDDQRPPRPAKHKGGGDHDGEHDDSQEKPHCCILCLQMRLITALTLSCTARTTAR